MEPWNGGLSSAQMRWLRKELQLAADSGEQVILASHHPLGKGLPFPYLIETSRKLKLVSKYLCLTVVCWGSCVSLAAAKADMAGKVG